MKQVRALNSSPTHLHNTQQHPRSETASTGEEGMGWTTIRDITITAHRSVLRLHAEHSGVLNLHNKRAGTKYCCKHTP